MEAERLKPKDKDETSEKGDLAGRVSVENQAPSTVVKDKEQPVSTAKALPNLEISNSEIVASSSERIRESLLETNQWTGRSQTIIEKDLRDSLRILSPDQIQDLKKEYVSKNGISLEQAFAENHTLSKSTKDALAIYLSSDNSQEKFEKLADSAIRTKNIDTFAEAMADATPAQRKAYQETNPSLADSFSGDELARANDFARLGHISTEKQVADNTGYLWNNYEGIDLAIKRMSDQEKSDYRIGRKVSGAEVELNPADSQRLKDMTPAELNSAAATYNRLHTAITAAGNATTVAKWESQITNPNTLFKDLESHRGMFYNSSTAEIQKSVSNMTEADWNEAKKNPAPVRADLAAMLTSLGESKENADLILKSFDEKLKADSYQQSLDVGKRSIISQFDDHWHWYKNDQRAMLDALSSMSAADRKAYLQNPEMKAELDQRVDQYLGTDQKIAAHKILDAIKSGEAPKDSIITTLAKHNSDFAKDDTQIVRDIRDAIKADPSIRQRLLDPKTDADKQFKSDFERLTQNSMTPYFYQNYVKELVNTGDLTAEKAATLSAGTFSNDMDSMLKDVAALSPTERNRIQTDNQYQQLVFANLSTEQKQVALKVAESGSYTPDDKIRTLVTGFGGSEDLVATVKAIPTDKLAAIKSAYEAKYGSPMIEDLKEKLSTQQFSEVKRTFAQNDSLVKQIDLARDDSYNTRSGFGAGLTDLVSATGYQTDDSLNQLIANAAGRDRTQSTKDLIKNLDQAVDNHRSAKDTAAEVTADGVIGAGAVAATIFTGGLNIPMTAAVLAAGGAVTKVGTKALINGQEYDWKTTTLAKDALIGAATGATAIIGPAEAAAVFKIGRQAAERSAENTFSILASKNILTQGSEQTIKTGMQTTLRQVLASGATKVDDQVFAKLANNIVSTDLTGEARVQAVALTQATLAEQAKLELSKETAKWLTHQARAQGLNTGGGAMGGATAGGLDATTQWNSNHTIGENLETVATKTVIAGLGGAAGALAIGGALKSAEFAFLKPKPEPFAKPFEWQHDMSRLIITNENQQIASTKMIAANDNQQLVSNQMIAANDNFVWQEEKLVMNGTNGGATYTTPRVESGTIISDAGTSGHTSTQSRQSLRMDGVAEVASASDVKPPVESRLIASDEQIKSLVAKRVELKEKMQSQPEHKDGYQKIIERLDENLTWLEQQRKYPEVNTAAYADLLKLHYGGPNKGALVVPLEVLRKADPATMQFVRDRMVEVGPKFNAENLAKSKSTDPFEAYGDRYEFAINQKLCEIFNKKDRNTIWKYEDRGQIKDLDVSDYIYIPGTKGSAMDHAKMDGIFVKVSSGDIIPVDIKSSEAAVSRHKIPKVIGQNDEETPAGIAEAKKKKQHRDRIDNQLELSRLFAGAPQKGFNTTTGAKQGRWEGIDQINSYIDKNTGKFVVAPSEADLKKNIGSFLGLNKGRHINIRDFNVNGSDAFPSADATQSEHQVRNSIENFISAARHQDQSNQLLKDYGDAVKMSWPGIDRQLKDQAAARRLEAAQAAAAAREKEIEAVKNMGMSREEAIKTIEVKNGAKEMGLKLSEDEAFYLISNEAPKQMEDKKIIGELLTQKHLQLFNELPGEVNDSIKRLINPETALLRDEMMRLGSLHAARLIADAKGTIDEVKIRTLAMQHLTEIERVKRVARGEETTNKPSRRN